MVRLRSPQVSDVGLRISDGSTFRQPCGYPFTAFRASAQDKLGEAVEEGGVLWGCGVDLKYPQFSPTQADDFVIGDLRNSWERL